MNDARSRPNPNFGDLRVTDYLLAVGYAILILSSDPQPPRALVDVLSGECSYRSDLADSEPHSI